jgi:hypothetical protein
MYHVLMKSTTFIIQELFIHQEHTTIHQTTTDTKQTQTTITQPISTKHPYSIGFFPLPS